MKATEIMKKAQAEAEAKNAPHLIVPAGLVDPKSFYEGVASAEGITTAKKGEIASWASEPGKVSVLSDNPMLTSTIEHKQLSIAQCLDGLIAAGVCFSNISVNQSLEANQLLHQNLSIDIDYALGAKGLKAHQELNSWLFKKSVNGKGL